ncbi:MAG: HAMP domain-containing sensor histidine kinase [Gemmiger sp.]|uniref:sensor histidine kinase n=1 Tax=Gemmiger sp. TaxID=2049027 RepID=UPI002E75CD96|nr:HAMP domain-containing sensor histidine kinase [Gemmiger sp.]MEE0800126.1 HAMP domain-containing sensor histidine kinase [Gemmiger sp.]
MANATENRHFSIPVGVRGQLMLFLCGITALTLGLVWVLITYALQPMYNRNIYQKLEKEASAIVGMIDSADGPISSRDFGPLELQNDEFWDQLNTALSNGTINVDNCCIDISDSTCRNVQFLEGLYPCILHKSMVSFGGVPVYAKDTATAVRMRQVLFSQGTLYEIVESGGNRQMMVGRCSRDGNYGVIVSSSLAQIETAGEVMRTVLPPVAVLLIGMNLLVAVLFSKWFTKPVQQLSAGAREIAAGNYDVQVDVRRRDELGLLGREFNHMAQEVKHSAQLEKDILANVSHDLRTPLTLIKGYAETVRDITGEDQDKRTEQCNIIVDETDRLSALVNSVMELSKVSSGAEKPNLVNFDMSELCFEVAGRYDALCEQNGWTLQLEADHACPVSADPAMMERVLHNLLGNATHHIGPDGIFILRAIPKDNGICRIEVEDHGPGIPPEDLPHIFDRYYRSRKDAGKTGTGLGLSITKAILQQHGFAFGVDSTLGKGSVFWFEMKAPNK